LSRKKKSRSIPEWVKRGQKATLVYDILAAAFKSNCDCEACQLIRENIDFLESLFAPSKLPEGGR